MKEIQIFMYGVGYRSFVAVDNVTVTLRRQISTEIAMIYYWRNNNE